MLISGVDDVKESAWTYIYRESQPKDRETMFGISDGKMDYFAQDGGIVGRKSLNVITNRQGNSTAYNAQDFGNWLWGQGGKRLGSSLPTLRTAAHVNNAINSHKDNPTQDYQLLDSAADQKAIADGYHYWQLPRILPDIKR